MYVQFLYLTEFNLFLVKAVVSVVSISSTCWFRPCRSVLRDRYSLELVIIENDKGVYMVVSCVYDGSSLSYISHINQVICYCGFLSLIFGIVIVETFSCFRRRLRFLVRYILTFLFAVSPICYIDT